jgi:hypothetical protein
VLALPFLAGSGSCGILYELWSWDEITENAERIRIDIEEGPQEIVGYERTNIWVQRHVYAFEESIGEIDYYVDEEETFHVIFNCDGKATCFVEHWLEVPQEIPIEVFLGVGDLSLFGLAGPVAFDVGEGPIQGDQLSTPEFTLTGGDLHTIDLTFVAPPANLTIDADVGEVALELPAGNYACLLDVDQFDIAPEIVCDDAAASGLDIRLGTGSVVIAATEP